MSITLLSTAQQILKNKSKVIMTGGLAGSFHTSVNKLPTAPHKQQDFAYLQNLVLRKNS